MYRHLASDNRLTTEAATYIGRAIAKSESLEVVRVSFLQNRRRPCRVIRIVGSISC